MNTLAGHAMDDTRLAIRMVRSRAGEWGIDPNPIGILGFSAGGELAADSVMQSDDGTPDATDPIERAAANGFPARSTLENPAIRSTVEPGMPPVFIAYGYNDRLDISIGMAKVLSKIQTGRSALRDARVRQRGTRLRLSPRDDHGGRRLAANGSNGCPTAICFHRNNPLRRSSRYKTNPGERSPDSAGFFCLEWLL